MGDTRKLRFRLSKLLGVVGLALAAVVVGGSDKVSADDAIPAQQGSNGADTFSDPHTASGFGPRIDPWLWVDVSCKVHAPSIESVTPDGYWYRIASAPWNDSYYAPANTFMNGDPVGGPYTNFTDFAIPDCSAASSGAPPTAFFSPIQGTPTGLPDLAAISDVDLALEAWTSDEECSPNSVTEWIPADTATLAGWSVGRLGPVYYLAAAGPERTAAVRNIVLFDPGSMADFEERFPVNVVNDTCDSEFDINLLLAEWLGSNDNNRLIVLTGADSEHKEDGVSTYAGLWKHYFAGIWGQAYAHRAQVCDYDGMSHESVLSNFSSIVENLPPLGSCPPPPSGYTLTSWHV
ncbi:MAG: hypothetical protein M3Q79_01700 [bacterium]|nr:hypothetical protein [bacterium]